jgi:hypothetical protein
MDELARGGFRALEELRASVAMGGTVISMPPCLFCMENPE